MDETVFFFFQLGNLSSLTLRQRLTKEIAVVGRLLKSAVEKTLATKSLLSRKLHHGEIVATGGSSLCQ